MLEAANYDAYYRVLDLEPGAGSEEQINDSWKTTCVNVLGTPINFAESLKEKATVR